MHGPGIQLLQEIVIVLAISVLVILVFQRFKIPTIIGFLLTGMLTGPYGLSLINASEEVDLLAEIGVILLLFIIGLEFSLGSLNAIRKSVFLGGTLQVVIVIGLTLLTCAVAGLGLSQSTFIGFLLALSSTAIVLKMLQESGQISSPHGKITLAILIFQDIIVVPMMLFTPMLAGKADNMALDVVMLLVKVTLVIGIMIVSARFLVPRLLFLVAQSKSRELFVLTIVGLCFSVAFLTSSAGLSLALGAFMAGLIISESEYSHQAISEVLPFREIFTSIFFISVGMLVDLSFLIQNLGIILLLVAAVMVAKFLAAGLATLALGYPVRTVLMVSMALFQVGEFSFILSKVGMEYALLTNEQYQYFLAVSVVTMILTPFVLNNADAICQKLGLSTLSKTLDRRKKVQQEATESQHQHTEIKDHIVIIGFGINGQNTAAAATYAGIPYVVIELNPERVKTEKSKGIPILFGDAVHEHILHEAKVWSARVAVIAISDPEATKKIILAIRSICRTVYIIARTRFLKEVPENMRLGANEVVPEELEASIEVFSRVLQKYLVPSGNIESFVQTIRTDELHMARPMNLPAARRKSALDIPDVSIVSLSISEDLPEFAGKSLAQISLRERYQLTLLAIRRSDEYITTLNGETKLENDDTVYLFGHQSAISKLNNPPVINFKV